MSKKERKRQRHEQYAKWLQEAEQVAAAMVTEDLAPEWGKIMGMGTVKFESKEYAMACALEDEMYLRRRKVHA